MKSTQNPSIPALLADLKLHFGEGVHRATLAVPPSGPEGATSLESRTLNNSLTHAPHRAAHHTTKKTHPTSDIEAFLEDESLVEDSWTQPSYRTKIKVYESGDIEMVGVFQEEKNQFKGNTSSKERKNRDRDSMSYEDLLRSQARARRSIRERVLQIDAKVMVTLTTREYCDFLQFTDYCKKFMKLWRTRFPTKPYVLVFEKHKKGDYHAHIATTEGYVDFRMLRKMWHYALTGKFQTLAGQDSPGNIDVKTPRRSRDWKTGGLARYICKYVSKDMASGEFNRKRYWASKGIPSPRTYTVFMPVSFSLATDASALFTSITGKKPKFLREFQLGWLTGLYLSTY